MASTEVLSDLEDTHSMNDDDAGRLHTEFENSEVETKKRTLTRVCLTSFLVDC